MGTLIKKKEKHYCSLPSKYRTNLEDGDIYQCECGKRWTANFNYNFGNQYVIGGILTWRRRYWPWPKANVVKSIKPKSNRINMIGHEVVKPKPSEKSKKPKKQRPQDSKYDPPVPLQKPSPE